MAGKVQEEQLAAGVMALQRYRIGVSFRVPADRATVRGGIREMGDNRGDAGVEAIDGVINL